MGDGGGLRFRFDEFAYSLPCMSVSVYPLQLLCMLLPLTVNGLVTECECMYVCTMLMSVHCLCSSMGTYFIYLPLVNRLTSPTRLASN